MRIDRELSRVVFIGALVTLIALSGIGFFLTFLSQVHNIGSGHYTTATAFVYAALNLPQTAYDMFPVAALIGAVFALGGLAANRELMILRVSGADIFRLVRAILWAGFALAVIVVVLGEFVAPPAKHAAEALRAEKLYAEAGDISPGGVWLKSGRDIVHVNRVETPTRLEDLYIYTLDGKGGLAAVRRAASADYTDGSWTLHQVRGTRFLGKRTEPISEKEGAWSGFVLPATFRVLIVPPGNLSWRELSSYLAYLRKNGLATAHYETAFWHKVAVPVSVLIMVLLALPFALGRMRSTGAGQRLALGVVVGLVYYLVDHTLIEAGAAFELVPLLAAWLPTAILFVVTVFFLRRAR
ncbi:MAG: LPS export ABC transporter permease LptG [Gammaproteobacteria bacterium]